MFLLQQQATSLNTGLQFFHLCVQYKLFIPGGNQMWEVGWLRLSYAAFCIYSYRAGVRTVRLQVALLDSCTGRLVLIFSWIMLCCQIAVNVWRHFFHLSMGFFGPGSSVGIATGYGLDDPGIESRWRRDFAHLSRPALGPTQTLVLVQWIPVLSRG